ncbi:TPA: hypothetical protein U1Y08_000885, partial [Streptococcus suis]|nr:hypothetical protein [Streptococcus suis]
MIFVRTKRKFLYDNRKKKGESMFDFEKYNKSTISTTEFNSKLEIILKNDWLEKDFGPSKNKANYRKNLKSIVILDAFNKIHL